MSMTNFTVLSKFRNKEKTDFLVGEIKKKGYSCYNHCDIPADPNNADAPAEEQMKSFDNVKDFFNDEYFKYVFDTDLNGLKNAEKVIVLLPAGNSVHIEAGIAYGMGKPLILIGEPEKADTLYLIFKERYKTIEQFLETI